eukprot:gnl/TRDRNA2_/TRDRNA2_192129_c0_seq1.p1 gnl/TRDRNA2_/TRDRNA2_192129_c0~~gnl/TRDRNA2_/TRDRNA2_192129_c0_seq1.p1  ORF type:complete len:260 (-),score=60.10 gnl/TRDRNA2_/TRDRNA2_192129_c0_seq1:121-900(-)
MEQLTSFANWLTQDDDDEARHRLDSQLSEERMEAMHCVLQEFSVLLEYEKLQEVAPPGVYVMPSWDSPFTWHGVLFARQGLYRGGVFKFEMELAPEDYPEQAPSLRFLTPIFHPLVDPSSGEVDLFSFFPKFKWQPGRDYAACALQHLSRSLLRREYMSVRERPPFNPEALELFTAQPAAFAERAAICARNSLQEVYNNDEPKGTALHFAEGPAQAHEEILGALRATSSSNEPEERKSMFVEWFCDHYVQQRCGTDSDL